MRRRSRPATRRSSAAPPALALLVALAAAAAAAEPKEAVPCEQVASIGVAVMTDDGAITLRLLNTLERSVLPPFTLAKTICQRMSRFIDRYILVRFVLIMDFFRLAGTSTTRK